MNPEKLEIDHRILVTGACGQIGTELVAALRQRYGWQQVIAADIRPATDELLRLGPYVQMDVTKKVRVSTVLKTMKVRQVYHLAAILSAKGEADPQAAWDINMQGLLNILEQSRQTAVRRVFWPSSIAVLGPDGKPDPRTVYGFSKLAGEYWCRYYREKCRLDVRSLRYPGLISYSAAPGGGTTDYAIDIFHQALHKGFYSCFLESGTRLPMMYMPDAIRATLELMAAPVDKLRVHTAYNVSAMDFTPQELAAEIRKHIPELVMDYQPDFRQQIAGSWPQQVDDHCARRDWNWQPAYGLDAMVSDMLENLKKEVYA